MFQRLQSRALETDINRVVTPMLDMTFQLLFFFVINFRPVAAEGQVDLILPRDPAKNAEAPALDTQDMPDEYRITAYSSAGAIDLLTFQMNQFEPDELKGNILGELKKKLKAIPPAGAKVKPPVIKISCDKSLRYSELMQIMNLCREQGFKDVAIQPIAPKKDAP